MGLRASVVVCVTSFLLGSLFTHWIADSLTLWKSPVTDEHLWTAAQYYSILTKGPVQILYALFTVIVLGGTTIFWSLRDGEAGNLMFDGGSIVLYGTTVIMYLYSVIPSLADKFTSIPAHQTQDAFPRSLRIPTLDLASKHLICSVALTGVLILQAGRWWAELADGDEEDSGYLEEKAADETDQSESEPRTTSS
ncbi:Shr3 amino acid permease chaperone [Hygrophoropsis aurantiaca]|uniref:Shr3 amino acid permease chaperone n=1 Tax=Hygrophoropsis aurantiaca TaxID=72124 RepID=A0ACB8AAZ8_9AGAM|nr:Shr3 amino acid permease chaperone [Hygrophoropsis aurantiaca]